MFFDGSVLVETLSYILYSFRFRSLFSLFCTAQIFVMNETLYRLTFPFGIIRMENIKTNEKEREGDSLGIGFSGTPDNICFLRKSTLLHRFGRRDSLDLSRNIGYFR